jgi:DUF4097 and DUF4098 domain-containing protein YvlB
MENRQNRFLILAICVVVCSVPALASSEGTFQRTLTVNGTASINLTTGSGNVNVRTGGSGQIQITGHVKVSGMFGSSSDERVKRITDNPPIQQSGNDIRIGNNGDMELFHNVSISYDLVVPADTRLHSHTGSGNQIIDGLHGPVEAESGSGGLTINSIGDTVRADTGSGDIHIQRVKGNVRAKAGSGSIRAEDVAGGFEGHTGSGHITLDQSAPGAVRAETGSGGLDLRGVNGSLDASAGSGTIDADGNPTGSWTVHTGSGSVRLKLASSAAFDLDAHTSSGSISVNQPVTVQGTLGRKEIRGKVRGGGVPIEVKTGSGNIEIE